MAGVAVMAVIAAMGALATMAVITAMAAVLRGTGIQKYWNQTTWQQETFQPSKVSSIGGVQDKVLSTSEYDQRVPTNMYSLLIDRV
jgi:hypothetical protein